MIVEPKCKQDNKIKFKTKEDINFKHQIITNTKKHENRHHMTPCPWANGITVEY